MTPNVSITTNWTPLIALALNLQRVTLPKGAAKKVKDSTARTANVWTKKKTAHLAPQVKSKTLSHAHAKATLNRKSDVLLEVRSIKANVSAPGPTSTVRARLKLPNASMDLHHPLTAQPVTLNQNSPARPSNALLVKAGIKTTASVLLILLVQLTPLPHVNSVNSSTQWLANALILRQLVRKSVVVDQKPENLFSTKKNSWSH